MLSKCVLFLMSEDVYGMITADSDNPNYYEQENVIVALHLFDGSLITSWLKWCRYNWSQM